jgi:hypothetical protein
MWPALDWLALAIGTVGTVLWAHNGAWAKYAAVFWFVSSIFWVAFAYTTNGTALGIRDGISIALYMYGAWRWLGKPRNKETA